MIENYILKLFIYLSKYDFKLVNNEVNDTKKLERGTTMFKYDNGSIYTVCLINTNLMTDIYYKEYLKWLIDYEERTKETAKDGKLSVNNVFTITIFVGESNYYNQIIKRAEEFEGQTSYSLYWQVDPETGEIISPDIQPNKFAKIDKVIKESTNNKNNFREKSFEEILIESKKTSNLVVKNKTQLMVYIITLINVLMFTLMEMNGSSENITTLIKFGALTFSRIFYLGEYWRLVTSCFLHIGIAHLANNTLALFIFGKVVEKYFGTVKFIIVYLGAAIVGSYFSLIRSSFFVAAGASGAIYGLMGAIAALTLFFRESINGWNFMFMLIYVSATIGIGALQPGTGNWAHIGGFVGGFLISILFLLTDLKPKKSISNKVA